MMAVVVEDMAANLMEAEVDMAVEIEEEAAVVAVEAEVLNVMETGFALIQVVET